jgi:hypothetical protein
MEKKLCFWIKSQICLEIGQTEAQNLNQLLFLALEIILSPWSDSSELSSYGSQLNSLIRVEVHLVKETIEQVSPDLELVWTLKINSQDC